MICVVIVKCHVLVVSIVVAKLIAQLLAVMRSELKMIGKSSSAIRI